MFHERERNCMPKKLYKKQKEGTERFVSNHIPRPQYNKIDGNVLGICRLVSFLLLFNIVDFSAERPRNIHSPLSFFQRHCTLFLPFFSSFFNAGVEGRGMMRSKVIPFLGHGEEKFRVRFSPFRKLVLDIIARITFEQAKCFETFVRFRVARENNEKRSAVELNFVYSSVCVCM